MPVLHQSGSARLDVTVGQLGPVTVVTARGEVDLATASLLENSLDEALAHRPASLVVDLSDVSFLAAVGMNVLLTARRRGGSATSMVAVADGPYTRRPMEVVGLSGPVPIYTELTAALEAAGA